MPPAGAGGEEGMMAGPQKINPRSLCALARKLVAMWGGPTLYSTFRNTDAQFREKILLTVSMANACGG